MWKAFLITFAIGLVFVMVTYPRGQPPAQAQPATDQADSENTEMAALTLTAHQLMRAELKDPTSAVFNYDLPRPIGLFCGTVRARNSFGGYGDDVYYILFPFGIVSSEQGSTTRFKRLWDGYCVDKNGKRPDQPRSPNHTNEMLTLANRPDRAWLLGQFVGQDCRGTASYFMGTGNSGISANEAFWSVRCSRGEAYEVGIPSAGPAGVLECSTVAKLHVGKCFTAIR